MQEEKWRLIEERGQKLVEDYESGARNAALHVTSPYKYCMIIQKPKTLLSFAHTLHPLIISSHFLFSASVQLVEQLQWRRRAISVKQCLNLLFSETSSRMEVKNTYEDFDDYVTTYEALLFEEVKAQDIQWQNKKEEGELQGIKLRMYLNEGDNPGADEKKLHEMRTLVTCAKTRVNFLKICNLSTIFREYVVVRSVGSLPFKDLILKSPRETSIINQKAWRISRPLEDFIRDDHNESHQGAIHEALSGKPFVLIQGPPGTGKTQTIIGLLSVLLHATPKRSVQKEVRRCVLDMPTEEK